MKTDRKHRNSVAAALLASALIFSGCGAQKTVSTDSAAEPSGAESVTDTQTQPIALTEEYWEANIGPGNYTVGVDIPLGVVDITAVAGSGRVESSDGTLDLDMEAPEEDDTTGSGAEEAASPISETSEFAQQILGFAKSGGLDLESVETLTDEEMQAILAEAQSGDGEPVGSFQSVGFMEGVVLSVSGTLTLNLVSSNADVTGMQKRARDGGPIALSEGSYEAGEDFPAGTYVITATDGIGSVYSEAGGLFVMMANPAEEGINCGRYVNWKCSDGDTLVVDGVSVELQKMAD